MVTTVTINRNISAIFRDGRTSTGSASISGTTNQTTMSQEQIQGMECVLMDLLTNSVRPTNTSKALSTKDWEYLVSLTGGVIY